MSELIASSHHTLIVGLGLTGVSVARYLSAKGKAFSVADERITTEALEQFKKEFPNINVVVGSLNIADWTGVTQLVISPGVPRAHPSIVEAIKIGISVVGDVELFIREAKAPLVAITGSNGKTTVTTLVGEMAKHAGVNVKVGGNIGTPCLDLLADDTELYVLELSSFQLESVSQLGAQVAAVLNLSQDHMDRYKNYQEYHFSKQRIYFGAKNIVANRDDPLTQPALATAVKLVQFGRREPDLKDFGLRDVDGQLFLAFGLKNILAVSELKIRGTHNYLNALAALAIGAAAGLKNEIMVEVLKSFTGLPHRCQWVARINEVDYYNDSKATNIGATLAALGGMPEGIVLIAGGDAKGSDFSDFGKQLPKNVKAIILIGMDGPKIFESSKDYVPCSYSESLQNAVLCASKIARSGDIVLLSPACASMDMFKNYKDRGEQFVKAVEVLCLQ